MPVHTRFALAVFALTAVVASCDRAPTRPPDKISDTDIPVVEMPPIKPVRLLSPEPEGRFPQNDVTIGCTPHANRGSGFRVAFDWEDVPEAMFYDVTFWQKDARFAAITRRITDSEYAETMCNTFVIDRNLNDWIWTVKASARITTELEGDSLPVVRDTVLSSEERVFGFEPCRLTDGRPCNAPPASPPSVLVARTSRRE